MCSHLVSNKSHENLVTRRGPVWVSPTTGLIALLTRYTRRTAVRPVLDRSWDPLLYCVAAAAAITLLIAVLMPVWGELALFTSLMFVTSSPVSTFLPSASEPILIVFGKIYPPLLLGSLGVVGIALAEWVNYRVFGTVLHARKLSKVRSAKLTRLLVRWFDVQPFATVAVSALTPIPFWIARTCAVLAKYPMSRFILATAVGRFPRIFAIALLGTVLPISTSAVWAGAGVLLLVCVLVASYARRRRAVARSDSADDGTSATESTNPHAPGPSESQKGAIRCSSAYS